MRIVKVLAWWMVLVAELVSTKDRCCMEGIGQYHVVRLREGEIVVHAKCEGKKTSEILRAEIKTSLKYLPMSLFSADGVKTYENAQYMLKTKFREIEYESGCFVLTIVSAYHKNTISSMLWDESYLLRHNILYAQEGRTGALIYRAYHETMKLVNIINENTDERIAGGNDRSTSAWGNRLIEGDVRMHDADMVQISGKIKLDPNIHGVSALASPRQTQEHHFGNKMPAEDLSDLVAKADMIKADEAEIISLSVAVYITRGNGLHLPKLPFIPQKIKIYLNPYYIPFWTRDDRKLRFIKLTDDQKSQLLSVMNEVLKKVNTEVCPMQKKMDPRMRLLAESAHEQVHFVAEWYAERNLNDGMAMQVKIEYSEDVWTVASGSLANIVHLISSTMVTQFEHSVLQDSEILSTVFVQYIPDKENFPHTYVTMEITLSTTK